MTVRDYPTPIPAGVRDIRALVLDVDGVLTDGRLHFGDGGEVLKVFHSHDGLGLRMLVAAGLQVAVVTARSSPLVERRMSQLGIENVFMGREDKRAALAEVEQTCGVGIRNMAYLGDDLLDLPAMGAVGLAMAVADAHPMVLGRVAWVSRRPGGLGAAREACDALISMTHDLEQFADAYLEALSPSSGRYDEEPG